MKQYKVSKEMMPYVATVLTRGIHTFNFKETEDGDWICFTPISSDNFHRIVQRAKCEKKNEETGNFYVTSRERNDTLYLAALLEFSNKKSYSVIDDPECKKDYNNI